MIGTVLRKTRESFRFRWYGDKISNLHAWCNVNVSLFELMARENAITLIRRNFTYLLTYLCMYVYYI